MAHGTRVRTFFYFILFMLMKVDPIEFFLENSTYIVGLRTVLMGTLQTIFKDLSHLNFLEEKRKWMVVCELF
jgi:hypothetical protein